MTAQILASSKEYLHIPLTSPQDISQDDFEVSFDGEKTWFAAEHETGGLRILIGPGSLVGALAVGSYRPRIRIVDNPEVPVVEAKAFSIRA